MNKESLLTQALIRELFEYNPDTGKLTRKKTVAYNAKKGDTVSTVDNRGYGRVKINGTPFRTHRIIWLYMHGEFPKNGIDHINRDKLDNRICNLRDASQNVNNKNASIRRDNNSGCPGVSFINNSKWLVRIGVDGKDVYIGRFNKKSDAIFARKMAENKYWGRPMPLMDKER